MQHPKRCLKCRRIIDGVTTNGVDLYVDGVKLPLDPLRVRFPCPRCGAYVQWNSERDRRGEKPQSLVPKIVIEHKP